VKGLHVSEAFADSTSSLQF